MKNLLITIIVALVISITSCSTLKSGSSTANSKEQMLMDATAMASIECEYKLSRLRLEDDRNNFKLKSQFKTYTNDIRALSRFIYKRYNVSTGLRPQFNDLVKSVRLNLTICRQLQEYEDKRAEKNIEK